MTIFPIKAADLVQMAIARVDQQSDTVKDQMVSSYLPQVVRVILTQHPDCQGLVGRSKERLSDYSRDIGQILWSHPGSMGGVRIEQYFVQSGFEPADADTLATCIIQYSRYVMAIINNLRHVRSAITGVRDSIILPNAQDRFFSKSNLDPKLQHDWFEWVDKLAEQKLKDEFEFMLWLEDIQLLVASLLEGKHKYKLELPSSERSTARTFNTPAIGSSNMAMAYVRRFGRYINREFGIEDLSDRYATKGKSILDELADLKMDLGASDSKVFALLEQDYQKRQSRIRVTTKPPASRAMDRQSYYEDAAKKLLTSHMPLDSRDLIVRNSTSKISPVLIEQMYKLFITQLKLEPNLQKFIGKTMIDSQVLEVELENPNRSDASKIKKYLEALFSN